MRYRNWIFLALVSLAIGASLAPTTTRAQERQQEDPLPPTIIRKSGGALQGSAIKRVEPSYPPLAKAAQVSGAVVVELTIDEEGNVIAARAISGHPLLKDSAVTAAKGWRFNQTRLQGVPVKVIGTITFNFNLGDPQELEPLEAEVRNNSSSAQAHLKLADAYSERGRNDEAVSEYNDAIRLNPDFATAYYQLGRILERLGRDNEALEAYQRAVTVKPELDATGKPKFTVADQAYIFMASIYFKKREYQESLRVLYQALSVYPDLDAAHYYLAHTHLELGDKQAALREYRILKEKNSEFAEELLRQIQKKK